MNAMPEVDWRRPYRYLAAIYHALVIVAGLIVVVFHRPFWSQYTTPLEPDLRLLWVVLLYAALDLIRIPFASGSTVSLSFPVVLTALLVSSNPTATIPIATAGSLLSELVYPVFFNRRRHPIWSRTLIRAVLHAGHHAVAGFAAAIAFFLFDPTLSSPIQHLRAVAAYVLVYGGVSMLVLWPHYWWVGHLLGSEEGLPRVEMASTVVALAPIPVLLNYLYESVNEASRWMVLPLALLFLASLALARGFAKRELERSKLDTERFAYRQMGSPPNLSELTQNVFRGVGDLVKYQWGALYSGEVEKESFRLRGQRRADGLVESYGLWGRKGLAPGTEPALVEWPDMVRSGDRFLGAVAKQGVPLVAFENASLAPKALLRLPANMALMALPLYAEKKGSIGLLVLARPRKLFTWSERDKAQALTEMLGSILYSVQHLEEQLQALYEEIERYAGQPERVGDALADLIRLNVNVPELMAAISKRTLRTNLRAVLRSVVTGRDQTDRVMLPPDVLEKVYKEVHDEDMPPWSEEIMGKLQTVISGLTFSFGFRYLWPDVYRSSEYKDLYGVLVQALDASTISDIVALRPIIEHAVEGLKKSSLAAQDNLCAQLERLQQIVGLLRDAENADTVIRTVYLANALQLSRVTEQSAESVLDDPERLAFVHVATTWQTVVNNALYAAQERDAELVTALGSNRVLPLEEVTVQLRLENKGPVLASGVVAEILPSALYEIGDERRVELDLLRAGDSRELNFKIMPHHGRAELRLVFQITWRDREGRERTREFADRVYLREQLAPFTEFRSPYTAGPPLGKGHPLFFGRDDVFSFIKREIGGISSSKHILLLVGERRMGKTSIVRQLPERLKDEPYVHVCFDCQSIADPGMAGFFMRLSEDIASGLQEVGLSIEHLSIDDVRELPRHVFETRFLPQVWQRIGDRYLLLTVDEFEALETRVKEGELEPVIFDYFRSLMQSQDKLALVFVGTHRIEELAADYWSVLFNIATYHRIGFLDQEPAVNLITNPVRPYGVVYDDLALNEILRLTAGHPYFLQLVCDCLMKRCNEQRHSYVTVEDVRHVRDEIIDLGRTSLDFVWRRSSRPEKAALSALASLLHSQQQVTVTQIVGHLSLHTRNLVNGAAFDSLVVRQALERLSDREIIKKTADGVTLYMFAADLYREYISKYKSLYSVIPELIRGPA